MIGRLIGTKEPGTEGKTEKYKYVPSQLSLGDPV